MLSLLYNIPKFFELRVKERENSTMALDRENITVSIEVLFFTIKNSEGLITNKTQSLINQKYFVFPSKIKMFLSNFWLVNPRFLERNRFIAKIL